MNFQKNIDNLTTWQNQVLIALHKITNSKNLKKILGAVLKFGNCLNAGNKQKGQADGFDLKDLQSTTTLKDSNGHNILMIICKMLYEDDNDFLKFKEEFKDVYDSVKLNTEDLKKQTNKLSGENNNVKKWFD